MTLDTAQTAPGGANIKAIGLVSGAHLYSHYYLLLLPPLFPLLKETFGVGYLELGWSITVLNIVTGLLQAPAGFLVDKVGARTLLIAALIVESLAFCVIGLVPVYWVLIAMMVVAGCANAIYHPADYAILNASVGEKHMGRAFSVHTSAGFLGGFLAPVTAGVLAKWVGWEMAIVICASTGILMAAIMIAGSDVLSDVTERDHRENTPAKTGKTGWALLLTIPVVMGVLFYVGLSSFGHALGSFGVATLDQITDSEYATLVFIISLYLFANPVGVLAGGWVADNIKRHDLFAAGCLVTLAILFGLLTGFSLPIVVITVILVLAGLLNGVVAPSRDMLIRAMTPPRDVGKVFGFVSTGFNIGGIVAPPAFGYLLDNSDPTYVFWAGGLICLAIVPTVLFTGAQGRKIKARAQ